MIATYLFFLEQVHHLSPVLFTKGRKIFRSLDECIDSLEESRSLWRETEILVHFGRGDVNEETTKVYICPFCGKALGDNTQSSPQDAIYRHLVKCPKNKGDGDGLKSKRFFVSDDPEVIRNYVKKGKEPITKRVFSSAVSGKLFHSKEGIYDELKEKFTKSMTLIEVQAQDRYEIEESFLSFLQGELVEEKVEQFVHQLLKKEHLTKRIEAWFDDMEESS